MLLTKYLSSRKKYNFIKNNWILHFGKNKKFVEIDVWIEFFSSSVNTQISNSHVDNKIPFQTLKYCQAADYQNIIRLRNYNAKQYWKENRDTVKAFKKLGKVLTRKRWVVPFTNGILYYKIQLFVGFPQKQAAI